MPFPKLKTSATGSSDSNFAKPACLRKLAAEGLAFVQAVRVLACKLVRLLADDPAEKQSEAKQPIQQSEPCTKLAVECESTGLRTKPNDLEIQSKRLVLKAVTRQALVGTTDRDTANGAELVEPQNPFRRGCPLTAHPQRDGARGSHHMWHSPSMTQVPKTPGIQTVATTQPNFVGKDEFASVHDSLALVSNNSPEMTTDYSIVPKCCRTRDFWQISKKISQLF